MGVLMLKRANRNPRRSLAVLGLLAAVSLFSIAPASATAQPTSSTVASASTTTPDGVFGWD